MKIRKVIITEEEPKKWGKIPDPERGERVEKLRIHRELSQADLAKAVHCSQTTIGKIEDGNDSTLFYEISIALRTTVEWIKTGKGISPYLPIESKVYESLVAGKIPVIEWDMVDKWIHATEKALLIPPNAFFLKPQSELGIDELFCLQIKNDLMVSETENYPIGSYIIVDSEKEYESGTVVVAKLSGATDAALRRYCEDGDKKYLTTFKANYPIDLIDPENTASDILGVVIEKIELIHRKS